MWNIRYTADVISLPACVEQRDALFTCADSCYCTWWCNFSQVAQVCILTLLLMYCCPEVAQVCILMLLLVTYYLLSRGSTGMYTYAIIGDV